MTGGTDVGNAVGDIVQVTPTAAWAKDLADGLIVSLDQDGTLKAGAVDNAAVLASNVVTTVKILDANVTTAKIADANVTRAKLATVTRIIQPSMLTRYAAPGVAMFPESGAVGANYFFAIPDDYVSGDITIRIAYRPATSGGVWNWARSVYRFRNDAAISTIVSTNSDLTCATGNTYYASQVVSAANFTTSDILRIDLARNQADSSTSNVELDGIWVEYTGRA